MATYFLTYELKKNKDYHKFYDELKRNSAQRVLPSVWCLNKNNSSVLTLTDQFSSLIYPEDKLLITESKGWAGLQLIIDDKK